MSECKCVCVYGIVCVCVYLLCYVNWLEMIQ